MVPKKIRVLQVTLNLSIGGLETIIMDICGSIDRDRFEVTVLCLEGYDDKYKDKLGQLGVKVHLIQRKNRYDLTFFRNIVRFIRKERIDVVHAHSGCFFNAALCTWLSGSAKLIYTAHGLPILSDGTTMETGIKSKIEDFFAVKIAKTIFAVSEEIKENLEAGQSGKVKKIKYINNGIDSTKFTPACKEGPDQESIPGIPEDRLIVGSVGRLVQIKNYGSFIRAVGRIKRQLTDNIHLVLVGDGEERQNLEKLAVEEDVVENVTFMGVQYHIERILKKIDVFVLPSWTEGTSISLLEAQSAGLPALVSNVGGNPGIIIDGYNGFLFEADDVDMLSLRIREIIEGKYDLKEMGENSRNVVLQRFDTKVMVNTYEEEYASIARVYSDKTLY